MLSKWKRSEKGQIGGLPIRVIIVLTIFIISFLFIFWLVARVMSTAEEATIDVACKASIAARARSVIKLGPGCALGDPFSPGCLIGNPASKINTIPLLCQPKDKKISGTKDEILEQFANLMAICWGTFSEGRFPYTIEDPLIEGDSGFPCYTVIVTEIKQKGKEECKGTPAELKECQARKTLIEDGMIFGGELLEYMHDNGFDYLNETETYYDYLTFHRSVPGRIIVPTVIRENDAYYIIYADPDYEQAENKYNGIYVIDVEKLNSVETWTKSGLYLSEYGTAAAIGAGVAVTAAVIFTAPVSIFIIAGGGAIAGASGAGLISYFSERGKPVNLITE